MTNFRTPGVYIQEVNAFGPSVLPLPTATAAFVGYTERVPPGGRLKPHRVGSLADFEALFGGPAKPCFELLQGAAAAVGAADQDPMAAPGQSTSWDFGGQALALRRPPGRAGGRFLLHLALRLYFLNGGGACDVVSVGGFDVDIEAGDAQGGLLGGIACLEASHDHQLLLVPEAVLLSHSACATVQRAMLEHAGAGPWKRFAVLDVQGGDETNAARLSSVVRQFREGLNSPARCHGAAYFPWLNCILRQEQEVDETCLTNPEVIDALILGSSTMRKTLLDQVLDRARQLIELLPPSAAVAGVYTRIDSERGVWEAPANVALIAVRSPCLAMGDREQEGLNVDAVDGKSINAIRSFAGKGVVVWGARTLDGNSNEWRYVNVRRFVTQVEQSCALALKGLVFEPNNANTWSLVRFMLDNFLLSLWTLGALQGPKPEQAFAVRVGLGETMTPQDVQAGRLVVQLMLAVLRPAEFTVVQLQQQLHSPAA